MPSSTRRPPKQPLDHEPKAVAYALDQSGLSQAELARACDVSESLISEILAGTRNARPALIAKMAVALNCPKVVLEHKRVTS